MKPLLRKLSRNQQTAYRSAYGSRRRLAPPAMIYGTTFHWPKKRRLKGKPYDSDHKANFYRCIRKGGLPVSDVFSHVQAMNTCYLCGIAARLGRVIQSVSKTEKISGDEQAAAFFARRPRQGFEIPRV